MDKYNTGGETFARLLMVLFTSKKKMSNERVSMGLTDRRKTAKNLADSRKN